MKAEYNHYTFSNYAVSAAALSANAFFPAEKVAKISWRAIDLTDVLTHALAPPFILLSNKIKDLVLMIESTRFFCVSFPLFFRDKSGMTFFETRTFIQIAEKISLTVHLALKTLFGADKLHLISLGVIGSYAIGHLAIFKWAVEGSILLYNFIGIAIGKMALTDASEKLNRVQMKLDLSKTSQTAEAIAEPTPSPTPKQRKWEQMTKCFKFEQNKAWLKIATTASKAVLIAFATGIAAINFWNLPCHITILALGIISDGIGLAGFYYQEYCSP